MTVAREDQGARGGRGLDANEHHVAARDRRFVQRRGPNEKQVGVDQDEHANEAEQRDEEAQARRDDAAALVVLIRVIRCTDDAETRHDAPDQHTETCGEGGGGAAADGVHDGENCQKHGRRPGREHETAGGVVGPGKVAAQDKAREPCAEQPSNGEGQRRGQSHAGDDRRVRPRAPAQPEKCARGGGGPEREQDDGEATADRARRLPGPEREEKDRRQNTHAPDHTGARVVGLAWRRMRFAGLLALLLVAAVVAAWALPGLTFQHDSRALLRADPEADALEEELVARFGSEDILLVAWRVGDATQPAAFARLKKITSELEQVEGLQEVYSLASPIVRVRLGSDLRAVSSDDLATAAGRARVRAALADTPYVGTIYSADLDTIAVAGTVEPGSWAQREAAVRAVYRIAQKHEAERGRSIHVAGVTALALEAGEYAVRDLKRIGLLALLASVAVLFVLCRSLLETLIAVLATGLPPLFALGCAAALGVPVTALGAALFPVLAVVGITSSVHLLHAYHEERRAGLAASAAGPRAARRLAVPITLSLGTTAAAFGSLAATSVPAFRAGLIVAIGLVLAAPVILLGVPAALALVRPPARQTHRSHLDTALARCAGWVRARPRTVFWTGCLLLAGGFFATAQSRLHVTILQAFEDDSRIARTYRFLDDHLTATIPVDIVLEARPDTTDAEVIADLTRFTKKAEADPAVQGVLSLATLASFGVRVSPFPVNVTGALAVLRLGFGSITAKFEDQASRSYRLKLRVREDTPPEALDRLQEDLAVFTTGHARLTGLYVRAVGTLRHLARDLFWGTLLIAALVVATVTLALRSWRLGLAALVPNLLPPALVFGAASVAGVALDVSAVAVGAVAVGLAVDDTLHVVFRLRAERGKPDALERTIGSVGRALVLSTIVLVAGLACLGASGFLPTARFGLFCAAASAVALPADLLVLPAAVRILRAIE